MKRKITTFAMVGAMAVAALAPATAFAAPVTSDSQVYYMKGADTPDAQGRYVISFPANIVFADDGNSSSTHEIALKAVTGVTLPTNLSVKMEVSSKNGMKLKDATAADKTEIGYSITYTGGNGVTLNNTNGAAGTKVALGSFTQAETWSGAPEMETTNVLNVSKNTEFTDVLTYTATHEAP